MPRINLPEKEDLPKEIGDLRQGLRLGQCHPLQAVLPLRGAAGKA